ncbi:hypothetical protein C0Q70_02618 [Pomacea canaliculata]|uniref:Uncharacterized protein n=1 Tax=Pomacea canaliculata TaxID=400727 RepID=A0A2T7PQG3_POMCA|nr:hypothetical protein C0Q70_02618 [Pomacea canaliculata]
MGERVSSTDIIRGLFGSLTKRSRLASGCALSVGSSLVSDQVLQHGPNYQPSTPLLPAPCTPLPPYFYCCCPTLDRADAILLDLFGAGVCPAIKPADPGPLIPELPSFYVAVHGGVIFHGIG